MTTVGRFLHLNPLTLREMRARVRGRRTFALVGLNLLLLTGIIYIVYVRSGGGDSYNYGSSGALTYGPTVSFQIGQNIFIASFAYLLVLMAIVAPVLTGGAVSREVEGRTFEMLRVTPLRARSVVLGKYLGALVYLMVLALTALPLVCICFLFTGPDITDVAVGYLLLVVSAATFAAIGLFFSGLLKHTGPAIVVSYLLIAVIFLGSLIISSVMTNLINNDPSRSVTPGNRADARIDTSYEVPRRILVVNPLAALGSVLNNNAPYRSLGPNEDLQFFPTSTLFGGKPTDYYRVATNQTQAAWLNYLRQPTLGNQALWVGYVFIYTALALLFWLLSLLTISTGRLRRLIGYQRGPKTPPKEAEPPQPEVTALG